MEEKGWKPDYDKVISSVYGYLASSYSSKEWNGHQDAGYEYVRFCAKKNDGRTQEDVLEDRFIGCRSHGGFP
jgi:hypothetical protein